MSERVLFLAADRNFLWLAEVGGDAVCLSWRKKVFREDAPRFDELLQEAMEEGDTIRATADLDRHYPYRELARWTEGGGVVLFRDAMKQGPMSGVSASYLGPDYNLARKPEKFREGALKFAANPNLCPVGRASVATALVECSDEHAAAFSKEDLAAFLSSPHSDLRQAAMRMAPRIGSPEPEAKPKKVRVR